MTEIYINDSLLDLFTNTVIPQNFKSFDLFSIASQYRNFTNTIQVPFTENNDRILGNANVIQSDADVPYQANTCKIVQNGVTIINDGIPVIKEARDAYNIFVISGLTFFDLVGDKKLRELEFDDINGQISIGAYINTTTGLIFPIIDYGQLDTTTYAPDYFMAQAANLPSMYYHTLIEKIFTDTGLAKSGTIFSDDKYLKTIIPFSKPAYRYGGTFIDDRKFVGDKTGSQVISTLTDHVTWGTVYNGALGYYDGTSDYTPVEADATTGHRLFGATVQLYLDITVSGGTVDILIQNANIGTIQTGVGTGTYQYEGVGQCYADQNIYVRFVTASGTPTVTVNIGSNFSILPDDTIVTGTAVYTYINETLPDMTQRELLTDFAIRFGQYFQERNGTVYCASIDDIISDTANAVDWTEKRVNERDRIIFTPSGLAKRNYLKYSNDGEDVLSDYAEAYFDIANENLVDQKVIQSKFGATNTELTGSLYMAQINVFEVSPTILTFDNDPRLRILLVRDRDSSIEPAIGMKVSAGAVATTTYKIAYFDDPRVTNSCLWQETIDNNYPLLVQSLQKYKMVVRKYNLTEADIQNLDFFKPVFDQDGYYIINTIGPYIEGRTTQVQMMKV